MKVPAKWIRGEVDRVAIAEGCYFDLKAALKPCEFIETICCQSIGRWKGKPIKLIEWQRDFLMRLYGWKRPDGFRRYRTAYLEIGKKNGKSTMVSCDSLYSLLADGEGAPEIYLNAFDKNQASIIFDEAARMVRASKSLASRLDIIDSKTDKRIVYRAGNGSIIANSSIAASKDGFNSHKTIFDELHRQPDRKLWNVFKYAGIAREQPCILSITTAGESSEGIWYEQREHSEKVNAGEVLDTSHLGVVYRALETDDLDDPKVWRKANPSMGLTMKEPEFAREWANAKGDPVARAEFLRFRFNIIQRGDEKAFSTVEWDACGEAIEPAGGEPVYGGMDLSSIEDLTSAVWICGDDEAGVDVFTRFWLPEDHIVELERKHRQPYRAWADAGYITLTPGAAVDYRYVRREVNEYAADHNLRLLNVDPANATQLIIDLEQHDGLPVKAIRQGFISMNGPTKEFIRLLRSGKIRHDHNPIMKWMIGNCVISTDEQDLIKLSKKKSRQKIDGPAALVNANGARIGQEDSGPSVYETRGVIVVR